MRVACAFFTKIGTKRMRGENELQNESLEGSGFFDTHTRTSLAMSATILVSSKR